MDSLNLGNQLWGHNCWIWGPYETYCEFVLGTLTTALWPKNGEILASYLESSPVHRRLADRHRIAPLALELSHPVA